MLLRNLQNYPSSAVVKITLQLLCHHPMSNFIDFRDSAKPGVIEIWVPFGEIRILSDIEAVGNT